MTRTRMFRMILILFYISVLSGPVWAQKADGGTFTLNLKQADITTLIATVSDITGRNFVIDPRVKGKVTVLSKSPMSADELYQAFLSVLDVHGFAATSAGEVTKIVPQINAKQNAEFGQLTDTAEEIVTRVIQLDNVPADQLVPILRPLVPQYGHLAAYVASNSLIISDRAANVARISRIVDRIDTYGLSEINSIPLKHADAEDVVSVLKSLQGPEGNKRLSVAADPRTNSIVISGDAQQRQQMRSTIKKLDTPSKPAGDTQVVYLDYADAEDLAAVLQDYAQSKVAAKNNSSSTAESSGGAFNEDQVSIIPEPGTNALVVTAPADLMHQIRSVIKQLDIRRGQVLLEGIVAEITLNRSQQLGVNIAAYNENGLAAGSILDSQTLQAIPSLALNGTPLNLLQQGLNLGLGTTNDGGTNFALLVNALSGNTDTNVLSTPSLITLDNEEAEITVGKEVPFVTGNYTSGLSNDGNSGLVNPFQTIERKQVGLTMQFTPQINAGDTVQLAVDMEISDIARNSGISGAVDLITNTRKMTTTVAVEDGQILVLGGLINNNIKQSVQKVPLLGDIPLLGALFTHRSISKERRNLLVFIRPTVLRGTDIAPFYTRKKYDYIRKLQQQHAHGEQHKNADQPPQLPPMDQFGAGSLHLKSHSSTPSQGLR